MSLSRWIPLALALSLPCCSDGSSSPAARNLGISGHLVGGGDDLWALHLAEGFEGSDLNADGDTFDSVLSIYDHATGELVEPGLALESSLIAGGDDLLAFGVREASQGGTDLNGDGDAGDTVLHVYDRRTGVLTNTGLATGFSGPAIGLGRVAFDVLEAAQGNADLDGDGTVRGSVLHVYDSETALTTNVGREVTSEIQFHDGRFAFHTNELSGGDLNGDGDATDEHVFAALDAASGSVTIVPLAVIVELATPSGGWYMLVSEEDQDLDLNGDGDLEDGVYHRIGPDLQTIEPLGLSSNGTQGLVSNGRFAALPVSEIDGIDRNGDGDLFDTYVALHDSVTGRTFAPALAVSDARSVFLGDRLAILVDERIPDEDLDGDGDRSDNVVHLLDPVRETSTNLGFDAGHLDVVGQQLVAGRGESAGNDWNGDGDTFDPAFFVWDPRTGELTNTRRAADGGISWSNDSSFLFPVDELQDGRDRNGDGDLHDVVFALYQIGPRRAFDLGLAVSSGAVTTRDGAVLLQVLEANQGVDLNGDGDFRDTILHVRE